MARSPHPSLSPQTSFLLVREDTKAAVLLYLLQNVVRPQDQTVVFVATKHHAEYLTEVSQGSRGWRNPWGLKPASSGALVALPKEATRGRQQSAHEPGWGFFPQADIRRQCQLSVPFTGEGAATVSAPKLVLAFLAFCPDHLQQLLVDLNFGE